MRFTSSVCSRVLIRAALCAVLAAAPAFAAVPQAPTVSAVTPAADFLAGLSAAPKALETPGVHFLSTSCTTSADCPTGQLCCPIGGANDGGPPKKGCFSPIRGHCPLFP